MVQDLVVVVDGLIAKFASWQLDPFESTITAIEEQFIYSKLNMLLYAKSKISVVWLVLTVLKEPLRSHI